MAELLQNAEAVWNLPPGEREMELYCCNQGCRKTLLRLRKVAGEWRPAGNSHDPWMIRGHHFVGCPACGWINQLADGYPRQGSLFAVKAISPD